MYCKNQNSFYIITDFVSSSKNILVGKRGIYSSITDKHQHLRLTFNSILV